MTPKEVVEIWIERFNRIMKERWYHFRKRTIWQQVPTPILMLILYLVVGIIALAIKLLAPGNFMDLIPAFGTFAFAMFRLFPVIGNISNMTMQVISVPGAKQRALLLETMDYCLHGGVVSITSPSLVDSRNPRS